jgi:hypothetical protein
MKCSWSILGYYPSIFLECLRETMKNLSQNENSNLVYIILSFLHYNLNVCHVNGITDMLWNYSGSCSSYSFIHMPVSSQGVNGVSQIMVLQLYRYLTDSVSLVISTTSSICSKTSK